MKINSKVLGIVVLVLIFGGIALAAGLGYWNTEGGGGSAFGISKADGSAGETGGESGSSSEAMIRGKTTFQELLDYGMKQETIEEILQAPMPEPGIRVKDYCTSLGLSFETIKEVLQAELDRINQ